jgi:CheY-like chemotaxis protein
MVVSAKKKILVVDPDPNARAWASRELARDFDVLHAKDGLEALEVMGRMRVEAVVTEMDMPRVDGLTLARKMKTIGDLKKIPVFFLTIRGAAPDALQAISVGAARFWTKPVSSNELTSVLNKLIR